MSIVEALSRIQKELHVPKGRKNSFGGYNFRNCEDILDAVKKLLPDGYGVVVSDEIVQVGDRFYVKATAKFGSDLRLLLTKSDGSADAPTYLHSDVVTATGWAREAHDKKGMDASQITGAASSYARKYALCGLFAIDDGNDADSHVPSGKTAAMPKAPASFTSDTTISFGKFAGKKISEVPRKDLDNYVSWLKTQPKKNPTIEAFIKAVEANI